MSSYIFPGKGLTAFVRFLRRSIAWKKGNSYWFRGKDCSCARVTNCPGLLGTEGTGGVGVGIPGTRTFRTNTGTVPGKPVEVGHPSTCSNLFCFSDWNRVYCFSKIVRVLLCSLDVLFMLYLSVSGRTRISNKVVWFLSRCLAEHSSCRCQLGGEKGHTLPGRRNPWPG